MYPAKTPIRDFVDYLTTARLPIPDPCVLDVLVDRLEDRSYIDGVEEENGFLQSEKEQAERERDAAESDLDDVLDQMALLAADIGTMAEKVKEDDDGADLWSMSWRITELVKQARR